MDQVKVSVGAEVSGLDKIGAVNKELGNLKENSGALNKELLNVKDATSVLVSGVSMVATAFGAWRLKETITDATLLAARVQTLSVVMTAVGNNAGYTSMEMEIYAKNVAKCGITTEESRQAVIRMAQNNLDLTKSSQLARVAQDAAVIANTNSSEAFSKMILGMSTGQAIILHHMGLMVDFERAYMRTAQQLGKTTTTLTEMERSQARLDEVLRVSVGIAGSYEAAMGTAGKQITSLARYHQELKKDLGDVFLPTTTKLVEDYTHALKALYDLVESRKAADSGGGSGSLLSRVYDYIRLSGNEAAAQLDVLMVGYSRYKQLVGEVGQRSPLGMNPHVAAMFEDMSYQGGGEAEKYQRDFWDRQAKINAFGAASDVPGPVLDPSEQGRLASLKGDGEFEKIRQADRRRKEEARAARELADQKEIQSLKKQWANEKIAIQAMIDESDQDVSALEKKIIEINKHADEALAKFGKIPGAKDLINKGRDAKTQEVVNQEYKEYETTLDGLNQRIRALNPDMTEHEKKILDVDDTVAKLTQKMPEYSKSWEAYGVEMKKALTLDKELHQTEQITPRQQYLLTKFQTGNEWDAQEQEKVQVREKAEFDHVNVMLEYQHQITQNKHLQAGEERAILIDQFNFEQQQATAQLQWKLEHITMDESQQEALRAEYRERRKVDEDRLNSDLANSDKKWSTQKKQMQMDVVGASIGFLNVLAAHSKGAAMASLVLEKGMNIANTYMATQTASMLAYASQVIPGDPTSVVRAEAARDYTLGMGYMTMGLIAATGIAQAAMTGGGGSGWGGGGSSGSTSYGNASSQPVTQPQLPSTRELGNYTFIFKGNVMDPKYIEDVVIPQITDAGTRNIRIEYLD